MELRDRADHRPPGVNGNRASPAASAGATPDQGGGLFNNGGDLTVNGGRALCNDADGTSGSGGGILKDQGTLVVRSATRVRSNTATRAGGRIEANVGDTALDGVDLSFNDTGSNPDTAAACTSPTLAPSTSPLGSAPTRQQRGRRGMERRPGTMTLIGVRLGNSARQARTRSTTGRAVAR